MYAADGLRYPDSLRTSKRCISVEMNGVYSPYKSASVVNTYVVVNSNPLALHSVTMWGMVPMADPFVLVISIILEIFPSYLRARPQESHFYYVTAESLLNPYARNFRVSTL